MSNKIVLLKRMLLYLVLLCGGLIKMTNVCASNNNVTLEASLRTVICGAVDTGDVKTVEISIYRYYFESKDYLYSERYLSSIENGKFKWATFDINETVYVSIVFPNGNSLRLYILQPGDSVSVWQLGEKVEFKGKGAGKFKCKYAIDAMSDSLPSGLESRELLSDPTKIGFHKFLIRNVDSVYKRKLIAINAYKDMVSPFEYELMKTDCLGECKYKLMNGLRVFMCPGITTTELAKDYYKVSDYFDIDTANGFVKAKSRTYCDYVFEKLMLDARIVDAISPDSVFAYLYKKIENNYFGPIRERLLTTNFIVYRPSGRLNNAYYNEISNLIFNPWFKKKISLIKEAYQYGQPLFDFSLGNQDGKKVNLSDFNGKVLVLEFWYTGCGACELLSEAIKQNVIPFFKDSPVVFISICTDKSKDRWINSIKSGKYGGREFVNLYTDGMGYEHPIINFYQFYGFPQLIISNARGKVFYANPRRPARAGMVNEISMQLNQQFIDLIREALTETR